jgi:hypothetical protein
MSGLEDILSGALGGNLLSTVAGHLGTDEAGANKAVGAALPALLGRMKANADTPDGAAALAAAVNKDHDGSFLDGIGDKLGGLLGGSNPVGGKIVGKVFGADADAAHSEVAQAAGISPANAGGLMAMLAPIVMGALGKHGASSGGIQAGGVSSLLGGLLGGGGAEGGGLGGMLGGLLGGGGLGGLLGGAGAGGALGGLLGGAGNAAQGAVGHGGAAAGGLMGKVTGMLDQNNDGSVVDDIGRMVSGGGGAPGQPGAGGASGILGKLMGLFRKR